VVYKITGVKRLATQPEKTRKTLKTPDFVSTNKRQK